MLAKLMRALEYHYEIRIELVQIASGIHELALHLIVLSLEKVYVVATFYSHAFNGFS